jgi:hypothetical protein
MDGKPRGESESRQRLTLGHLFEVRTDHGAQARHVFLRTLSSYSSRPERYDEMSE